MSCAVSRQDSKDKRIFLDLVHGLHCVMPVLKYSGSPHTKMPSTLCLASSTAGDLQLVAGFGKRYGRLASRSQGVQEGRGKDTCLFQGLSIVSINILDDLNLDLKSHSPSRHLLALGLHECFLLRMSQFWIYVLFLLCAGDLANGTGGATMCKTAQVAQQLMKPLPDPVLDSVSFLSVIWHFSVSQQKKHSLPWLKALCGTLLTEEPTGYS